MRAGDGREVLSRFAAVLLRTWRYAALAANLARDGRLSPVQKAGAVASLGYVLSPIDLLPGLIPVVGQLDDLAVLIGGLRCVLRSCPPEVAQDHLARAGLTINVVDADLATVRDTAWWIARRGADLFGKAVRASSGLVASLRRSRKRKPTVGDGCSGGTTSGHQVQSSVPSRAPGKAPHGPCARLPEHTVPSLVSRARPSKHARREPRRSREEEPLPGVLESRTPAHPGGHAEVNLRHP